MNPQSILVTGATGFLGRHVVPLLERRFPERTIMAVGSEGGDLTHLEQAHELLLKTKPDCVIHLAGYGGGSAFNRAWTADCLFQNAAMTLNLFEAAAHNNVRKFVYPMPAASYPERLLSPVSEGQLWSGSNSTDHLGFSMGKRIGAAAAEVYRWQYGMKTAVLVTGELYGEYANFRPQEASIVAQIITQMRAVELSGQKTLSLSAPLQPHDLVYAGDVAEVIPWFVDNDQVAPINVSQGVGYQLQDVVEAVRAAAGLSVAVTFADDPHQAPPHVLDISALTSLDLACPTPLKTGVKRMVKWYLENLNDPKPGFRA
jgi:GDP-L-fucose synthase